jgi:hypothetical protein
MHDEGDVKGHRMKFILVNGRTPRSLSSCVLCLEPIGETYLREIATRLPYCDYQCYRGQRKMAARHSTSGHGADIPFTVAGLRPSP